MFGLGCVWLRLFRLNSFSVFLSVSIFQKKNVVFWSVNFLLYRLAISKTTRKAIHCFNVWNVCITCLPFLYIREYQFEGTAEFICDPSEIVESKIGMPMIDAMVRRRRNTWTSPQKCRVTKNRNHLSVDILHDWWQRPWLKSLMRTL